MPDAPRSIPSIMGNTYSPTAGWGTPQLLEDDNALAHGSTLDLDFDGGVGLAVWVREETVGENLTRKIFGALYR